jgi:hypothetical protein
MQTRPASAINGLSKVRDKHHENSWNMRTRAFATSTVDRQKVFILTNSA